MKMDSNTSAQTPPQTVIYGQLPDQVNDEINLGEVIRGLLGQWKLLVGITAIGTLLAIVIALTLPVVYQPSVTLSLPLASNTAAVDTINKMVGENSNIPSTPQAIFSHFYNVLRAENILANFMQETGYLNKLYPDSNEPESVLLAEILEGFQLVINEPSVEKKGAYIANPKRVTLSIEAEDEAVGVDVLNQYVGYVNKTLVQNAKNNANGIIENKIDLLNKIIARQREQYLQERLLSISKMEQDNEKEIALLEEQITAYLEKSKKNRATRIANAEEALAMAKSLGIMYPTTVDNLAQKGQKEGTIKTAITVVDKQSASLYLQGEKYLSTLIQTLEKRESDEEYLSEINTLREKIHIIKNDQVLVALKKRTSDDPWIPELSIKLAKISSLQSLQPDFSSMISFNLDAPAIVTNEKIKPKRVVIVMTGIIFSFFLALFITLIHISILKNQ